MQTSGWRLTPKVHKWQSKLSGILEDQLKKENMIFPGWFIYSNISFLILQIAAT